ncbi:MAG TPA: adenylate/guanylate cyclase domain-containing protein [Candidatus Limnocylindria bacterium]|jgi:class 3 adenylate cyclase|nr:adenylate/guanylate cyclase domain-containing protein [Candidatus Limnocylindria bacterium]
MGEERRLVTVLFADVAGSSRLAEVTDPEEVRALLARFFAMARDVVTARGGTVEKFIGDAVMAIFGVPQAHEDDAARAISAGLALRDRLRADPALGHRLPIRLGVATGEVVASIDPTGGDFIVTGDAANVAARLQEHAGEWEVLASARTARAAGHAFARAGGGGRRPAGRGSRHAGRGDVPHRPRIPALLAGGRGPLHRGRPAGAGGRQARPAAGASTG